MAAVKMPQVLRLDPVTELMFAGPHTEIISSKLRLENPSNQIVYFKVKTTAPKHYCVRPNSGIIKAHQTAEINVHLQPVDSPAILEKEGAKHKFMIQAAFADSDNASSDDFWKTVMPHQVMDSKLRVAFNLTSPENAFGITGAVKVNAPSTPPASTPVPASAPKIKEQEPSSGGYKESTGTKKPPSMDSSERKELLDQIARLTRLNNNANAEIGIPMIQVILIAFAALLIGLILGKMF